MQMIPASYACIMILSRHNGHPQTFRGIFLTTSESNLLIRRYKFIRYGNELSHLLFIIMIFSCCAPSFIFVIVILLRKVVWRKLFIEVGWRRSTVGLHWVGNCSHSLLLILFVSAQRCVRGRYKTAILVPATTDTGPLLIQCVLTHLCKFACIGLLRSCLG